MSIIMVEFIWKHEWKTEESIRKWRKVHHYNTDGDICFCGRYTLFYECRHPPFTDMLHPCGLTESKFVANRAVACYSRLAKIHVHNVIIIGICDHCEAMGEWSSSLSLIIFLGCADDRMT